MMYYANKKEIAINNNNKNNNKNNRTRTIRRQFGDGLLECV